MVVSAGYAMSPGLTYGQINPAFLPPSPGTASGGVAYQPLAYNIDLGEQFKANSSFGINALGFYDVLNADGKSLITGPEMVGIYDSSGTLLSSATIDPTTAMLFDHYYWVNVPRLQIQSGATYMAVVWTEGQDYGATPQGDMQVASQINLVTASDAEYYNYPASGLVDPTTPETGNNITAYFGPNFSIVPDGGLTVLLLGMGLAGLGCIRRKLA